MKRKQFSRFQRVVAVCIGSGISSIVGGLLAMAGVIANEPFSLFSFLLLVSLVGLATVVALTSLSWAIERFLKKKFAPWIELGKLVEVLDSSNASKATGIIEPYQAEVSRLLDSEGFRIDLVKK